jgi:Ni2+-binding GTPase involved in maturation of urease and hydrogenase
VEEVDHRLENIVVMEEAGHLMEAIVMDIMEVMVIMVLDMEIGD